MSFLAIAIALLLENGENRAKRDVSSISTHAALPSPAYYGSATARRPKHALGKKKLEIGGVSS
jgi:hypothetical protein